MNASKWHESPSPSPHGQKYRALYIQGSVVFVQPHCGSIAYGSSGKPSSFKNALCRARASLLLAVSV